MIHNTVYKVDLHTHSVASYDGSITEDEYTEIIAKKVLDYIAITDHNRIDFAQKLHEKLGDKVIVGEEIMTTVGEVIGLFLTVKVDPQQSAKKTIEAIHAQGGLVYVPHPFDTLRHGIGEEALVDTLSGVDIIEGFNGRMVLRWQNKKALKFAQKYAIPYGAGSDAHSIRGLGSAYTIISKPCTKESITSLLEQGELVKGYQSWYEYLRPKYNRMRKLLH